jgi:hypothetical protein
MSRPFLKHWQLAPGRVQPASIKKNEKAQSRAQHQDQTQAGSGEAEMLVEDTASRGTHAVADTGKHLIKGQVLFWVFPGGAGVKVTAVKTAGVGQSVKNNGYVKKGKPASRK